MKYSPMLLLHIVSGTLGMLSGFVAVFLRKGSREHGIAGNIFVITMLSLGATGAYMAVLKSQPANILGGLLTFYLVATAWLTARRKDGNPRMLDWELAGCNFCSRIRRAHSGNRGRIESDGIEVLSAAGALLYVRRCRCFGYGGRCSHAAARGNHWHATHRAPSVAHVLCAVYRSGVDLSGAAAPIPRFHAQNWRARFPEFPASATDDLLAHPRSLCPCLQAESDGSRPRLIQALALLTAIEAAFRILQQLSLCYRHLIVSYAPDDGGPCRALFHYRHQHPADADSSPKYS